MYDKELLREKLTQVAEALARVGRRFANIYSADDFLDSEHYQNMLDVVWNRYLSRMTPSFV